MQVLHCYRTYFPDSQGGGQEAIRQIMLSTQAEGVGNTIFALSPKPYPPVIERAEGVVVRRRSWAAPASCDLGAWDAVRCFGQLARAADVIHYHYPWPFADFLHMTSGARRKPAVMTYHSDIVRQRVLGFIYHPLMASMLRSMDAVVTTSDAYARTSPTLRQFVQPDRLAVIPLGIVEASYAPALADARSISLTERFGLYSNGYFLSLGVLRYYKGLYTLIEAARGVDVQIVVAGDGPMRSELERAAGELPAGRIRFLGHVSDAEKMALMQGCRAFVLPSHLRSEAFGMVLVEAAMLGRPMISCEIGTGTSYVNLDQETGMVICPEDARALASALRRFLADESFGLQCGRRARARYDLLFSGAALGRAYLNLYQGVVSRRLR